MQKVRAMGLKRTLLVILATLLLFAIVAVLFLYSNKMLSYHTKFTVADSVEVLSEIEGGNTVLIYYGSDRCYNCRLFGDYLWDIVNTTHLTVYYADNDDEKSAELIDRYNLSMTPTFLHIENGKVQDRWEAEDAYEGVERVLS